MFTDIISVCNKVAERSRPAGPNQCSRQKTFYPLREHDYDGRAAVGHKARVRPQTRGRCSIKAAFVFCIVVIYLSAFIGSGDNRKETLLTAVELLQVGRALV